MLCEKIIETRMNFLIAKSEFLYILTRSLFRHDEIELEILYRISHHSFAALRKICWSNCITFCCADQVRTEFCVCNDEKCNCNAITCLYVV